MAFKKGLITKCKVCLLPQFHAFYVAKMIILRGRLTET